MSSTEILEKWRSDRSDILAKSIEYLLDKDHIWCQYYEIALESFSIYRVIFEDQNYSLPYSNTFLEYSTNQISSCLECSIKYREIKEICRKKWSRTMKQQLLDEIFNEIQLKEKTRVKEQLDLYKNDEVKLVIIIHEVINNIDLLEDLLLKKRFLNIFEKFVSEYSVTFGDPNKIVPGLYLMLFAKSKALQEWAIEFLLETQNLIKIDQYGAVDLLVGRIINDIEFSQNNSTTLIENTILSDNIDDTWSGLPMFLSQFEPKAFLGKFPKDKLLYIIFKELSKVSNKLRTSTVESAIVLFRFLKDSLIKEFNDNNGNNGSNNSNNISFTIFQFCESVIDNFIINSEQMQIKIIELLSIILFECLSKGQLLGDLSNQIVGSFLNRVFSNSKLSSKIKSNLFVFIIEILLNSFSINYINLWGNILVMYSTNQIYESIIPNYVDMKKAIILLEHCLLYSAVELRKRMQLILNSNILSLLNKEVQNSCEYWFSNIWSSLLESSPTTIPYRIHLTIFNVHRVLGLLSTSSIQSHSRSIIYKSLESYQELMAQYLNNFTEKYLFKLQPEPSNIVVLDDSTSKEAEVELLDVLDSVEFQKSVFSFLVSPNQKISAIFKLLLTKKFTKPTVTAAFKEMIAQSPEEVIKGSLGIFRDFFIQLGFMNCLDSVNMIYYYSDHLIYTLKSSLANIPLYREYLSNAIDILWPSVEFALTLKEKIITSKLQDKLKYMFDWIKDCMSTIGSYTFSTINELSTPKPSFLYSCGNSSIILFDSIEQYPVYIRKSMVFTKCIPNDNSGTPLKSVCIDSSKTNYSIIQLYQMDSFLEATASVSNYTNSFLDGYEFFFENLDLLYKHINTSELTSLVVIEDESNKYSNIMSIPSRWVKSLLDWNLVSNDEWLDSIYSIIKCSIKTLNKIDKNLDDFIKKVQNNQIQLNQNQLKKFNSTVSLISTTIDLSSSIDSNNNSYSNNNYSNNNYSNNSNNNIISNNNNVSNKLNTFSTSKPNQFQPTSSIVSTTSTSLKPTPPSSTISKPQAYTTHTLKPSSLKPIRPPSSFSTATNTTTTTNFSNNKPLYYSDNIDNKYKESTNKFSTGFGFKNPAFSYMRRDFSEIDSQIDSFERNSVVVPLKEKKKTMMLDIGVTPAYKKLAGKNTQQEDEDIVPKIETLHKIILKWDPKTFDKDTEAENSCRPVPPRFNDVQHYISIFQPLLIEEFRAQVQRNIEEGDQLIDVIVENQLQENEFLDIDMEIPFKDNLDLLIDDYILIVQQFPQPSSSSATSISKSKLSYKDHNVLSAFGKIEKKDRKGGGPRKSNSSSTDNRAFILRVRFYKSNIHPFTQAIYKQNNKWAIQKITSLSTVSREYMALQFVGKIPLGQAVITPQLFFGKNDSYSPTFRIPSKLCSILNDKLNSSQMSAVNETCKNSKGFTLLQGPPGTGKTKTIMSLLSVFSSIFSSSPELQSSLNENGPKILVCAPSNAAVDEIAIRIIKEGILDSNGNSVKPAICRIGHLNHIHQDVHKIAIDKLLDQEVESDSSEISIDFEKLESSTTKVKQLKQEISKTEGSIRQLEAIAASLREKKQSDSEIKSEINTLYQNKNKTIAELKLAKEEERVTTDKYTTSRKNLFIGIISKCNIILSTLAGSGHENLFAAIKQFDLVIIDEAAQAVELSTLIPLRHNVKKCILVGDPQQLPPTTLSQCAAKFQYEVSLFQRLANSGLKPTVLKTQYRMHPTISKFPSQIFYKGELEDGDNVKYYKQSFYQDFKFGPLIFYDVFDSFETKGSFMSLKNETEASLAKLIIDQLYRQYSYTKDMEIGVITPYKAQMILLSQIFSRYSGVEVNTIDGFQGKEKDIIIFSTVRAHGGHSIGFLSDVRRMNVGLTRGKYSMIILGSTTLLSNNSDWNKLVQSIKSTNNCYYPISRKSILSNKLDNDENGKESINHYNDINNNSQHPPPITKAPPSLFIKKAKKPAAKISPSLLPLNSNIIPTTPSPTNASPSLPSHNLHQNQHNNVSTQLPPIQPSISQDQHKYNQKDNRDIEHERDYDRHRGNRDRNDRDRNDRDRSDRNRSDKDRYRNDRDKDRSDKDKHRNDRDKDRRDQHYDRYRSDRDRSDRYRSDRDRDRNEHDRDRRNQDYDDRDRKKVRH